jgi:hypothetical protein
MRKVVFLLAFIGLASSLWGADPIIGTWKLNLGKSRIPQTAKAPKEMTDIYQELGTDQIKLMGAGTLMDGP